MNNYLFHEKGELCLAIETRKNEIKKEIESQDSNYVLNVNQDDYIQHIYDKYFINPAVLKVDEINIYGQKEKDIDVSRDPDRYFFMDDNRTHYLKGLSITFAIPFEGEADLFKFRTSTFSTVFPRGEIYKNDLLLTYEGTNLTEVDIKNKLNYDIRLIKDYVSWANADVEPFNSNLKSYITLLLNSRREKLLKNLNLVASLGFPMRKNQTYVDSYIVPTSKKIVHTNKPIVKETHFTPEPTIDMQTYEDIIETLQNMVLVMESGLVPLLWTISPNSYEYLNI